MSTDDFPRIRTNLGLPEGQRIDIWRFSDEGRRVWAAALMHKQEQGRPCLNSADLVIGMIDAALVRVKSILIQNVTDVQSLRRALSSSASRDLEAPLRGRPASREANQAMAIALTLDSAPPDGAGSVELLIGILRTPGSGALAVLRDLGVDPAAIESQLNLGT
jgi:ATP-dependent Clp protease ATP-binding subunit ClpA